MKKVILCILFYSIFIRMLAQNSIIPNGDFEGGTFPASCITGTSDDFGNSNGNILDWDKAKHNVDKNEGNPDWLKYSKCGYDDYCSMIGSSYINSQKYIAIEAKLFRCYQLPFGGFQIRKFHEAVCVSLPNSGTFNQYQYYKIRYKIIPVKAHQQSGESSHSTCINARTNCHLRIFLSSGGRFTWNKSSSDTDEIYNANYVGTANSYCIWQVVEREFVVNTSGLKTLVLYAESGGFIIDDVEIFPSCEANYLIQNKNYSPAIYPPNSQNGNHFSEQSSNQIVAGNNVGASTSIGNVTVQQGSSIVYTATNKIILKPGFKAEASSYFHAVIAPCPNTIRANNILEDEYYYPTFSENEELENLNKPIFELYPNPSNGVFTIENVNSNISIKAMIIIYNLLGEVVESLQLNTQKMEMNIANFPKGVYFVHIQSDNGFIQKEKIIVQ